MRIITVIQGLLKEIYPRLQKDLYISNMNYSVHFPEKIRAISPDSQIQVNVPNTNQMEKFIILSRNLESKQEEDLTP